MGKVSGAPTAATRNRLSSLAAPIYQTVALIAEATETRPQEQVAERVAIMEVTVRPSNWHNPWRNAPYLNSLECERYADVFEAGAEMMYEGLKKDGLLADHDQFLVRVPEGPENEAVARGAMVVTTTEVIERVKKGRK